MTLAGTPPTSVNGSTSFVTKEPAAITAASSYVDAICQNSPGPDPDVIFDPDALGAESPLADWLSWDPKT